MRNGVLATVVIVAVACSSSTPALTAEDRDRAMTAATQCTDAVDTLAPSYQMVGPRLAQALQMDRTEAQRLMRDSIELLISTRELLCNVSQGTIDDTLARAPRDEQTLAAKARVATALARLAHARAAYDTLLGTTSAPQPPSPVDQDAALQRFQRALLGT